jgi:hypothetical protein
VLRDDQSYEINIRNELREKLETGNDGRERRGHGVHRKDVVLTRDLWRLTSRIL